MVEIDRVAEETALKRFALPHCLHVPIAARSITAIEAYIGKSYPIPGISDKAIIVRPEVVVEPNSLRIWTLPNVGILHAPTQVWVHVDYADYRRAYGVVFPEHDLRDKVLDHVLNRRVARLKEFFYLRIVPISRSANSSSGGLSEKWAFQHHSKPEMLKRNRESLAQIQYADLADIVKMLDIKTGGAHQDPVNDAQKWLSE